MEAKSSVFQKFKPPFHTNQEYSAEKIEKTIGVKKNWTKKFNPPEFTKNKVEGSCGNTDIGKQVIEGAKLGMKPVLLKDLKNRTPETEQRNSLIKTYNSQTENLQIQLSNHDNVKEKVESESNLIVNPKNIKFNDDIIESILNSKLQTGIETKLNTPKTSLKKIELDNLVLAHKAPIIEILEVSIAKPKEAEENLDTILEEKENIEPNEHAKPRQSLRLNLFEAPKPVKIESNPPKIRNELCYAVMFARKASRKKKH